MEKAQKKSPRQKSPSTSSEGTLKKSKKLEAQVEVDLPEEEAMKDQKRKQQPEEPQPISSDDDDDWKIGTPTKESDVKTPSGTVMGTKAPPSLNDSETSCMFAPYRTVGVVASGRPFHLIPHQNSASAMLCVPIGERFHMVQCDKLQPILVSQKVPSGRTRATKKPQHISHMVSDATLSISVVAHGPEAHPDQVTLYGRTRPLHTLPMQSQRQRQKKQQWKIVDLLHLGRTKVPMTGEKEGKFENAAIVAVILSYSTLHDSSRKDANMVDVVGSSDDEDTSDDDDISSTSSHASSEEDTASIPECLCQVVIMLATRVSLKLHKRIKLSAQPTFLPQAALHPSTYVNKIVIGGSVAKDATPEQAPKHFAPALILLNIRSGEVIHEFSCMTTSSSKYSSKQSTSVTTLEQSPAVDTVAVGTDNGKVHLINLRLDKTLFTVTHKPRDGSNKAVRITSISFRTDGSAMNYGIAPMAVGRADGTITVWNLNPPDEDNDGNNKRNSKRERTILTELYNAHSGGVSKLMYLPQEPLLVSIGKRSNSVLMHIFDSPDHSGRILRQRKGHTAAPSRIQYLHPGATTGGGIMVNMSDGTDASACQILSSGGLDRTLRVFSTARTVLDKEYSQGKGLEKKAKQLGMDSTAELLLPPVTAMALCEARSRDWGDLVTIHKEHAMAYVWSTKRGAQSGPVLRQSAWNVSAMKAPPPPSAHAVSVAMSACGSFAVVGTKGGTIYKYNVQSGSARGSYPRDAGENEGDDGYNRKVMSAGDVKRTTKALEKKMKISNRASNLDRSDQDAVQEALSEQRRLAKLKQACHTGSAVTGLAVDSTNKTVISVGADAKLILWHFSTHAPHSKSPYMLPTAATLLCHVRDSDLAAIALEDFSTLLFDCTTLSIVRRFGVNDGSTTRHSGPISDVRFGPDGRILFTASLDGTIRVWDVPTNTCVDWLGFETPPTSLAVSPTGEFLATSHVGKLGLSIWSDKSYYQTVHVNGAKDFLEPCQMDEPRPLAEAWDDSAGSMSGEPVHTAATTDGKSSDEANASPELWVPPTAKQKGLVTLSNLPPAHWKNLFHLELIKERNKPKEAPKKPPSAPFFLQWRGGESMSQGESAEIIDQPMKDEPNDEEEWKAAWSDDDDGEREVGSTFNQSMAEIRDNQAQVDNTKRLDPINSRTIEEAGKPSIESKILTSTTKRRKVSHHRSQLATLLQRCYRSNPSDDPSRRFQDVTDHVATLGPSTIDVSLSSLCNGMHDLEEGLPLLRMACLWLLEACESRERYEAVNAYLHRFLHIHALVIAGIEESWDRSTDRDLKTSPNPLEQEERERQMSERKELIECLSQLRMAQQSGLELLNGQLQNSLCLLRHFCRMV